jgi:hypothetical protein
MSSLDFSSDDSLLLTDPTDLSQSYSKPSTKPKSSNPSNNNTVNSTNNFSANVTNKTNPSSVNNSNPSAVKRNRLDVSPPPVPTLPTANNFINNKPTSSYLNNNNIAANKLPPTANSFQVNAHSNQLNKVQKPNNKQDTRKDDSLLDFSDSSEFNSLLDESSIREVKNPQIKSAVPANNNQRITGNFLGKPPVSQRDDSDLDINAATEDIELSLDNDAEFDISELSEMPHQKSKVQLPPTKPIPLSNSPAPVLSKAHTTFNAKAAPSKAFGTPVGELIKPPAPLSTKNDSKLTPQSSAALQPITVIKHNAAPASLDNAVAKKLSLSSAQTSENYSESSGNAAETNRNSTNYQKSVSQSVQPRENSGKLQQSESVDISEPKSDSKQAVKESRSANTAENSTDAAELQQKIADLTRLLASERAKQAEKLEKLKEKHELHKKELSSTISSTINSIKQVEFSEKEQKIKLTELNFALETMKTQQVEAETQYKNNISRLENVISQQNDRIKQFSSEKILENQAKHKLQRELLEKDTEITLLTREKTVISELNGFLEAENKKLLLELTEDRQKFNDLQLNYSNNGPNSGQIGLSYLENRQKALSHELSQQKLAKVEQIYQERLEKQRELYNESAGQVVSLESQVKKLEMALKLNQNELDYAVAANKSAENGVKLRESKYLQQNSQLQRQIDALEAEIREKNNIFSGENSGKGAMEQKSMSSDALPRAEGNESHATQYLLNRLSSRIALAQDSSFNPLTSPKSNDSSNYNSNVVISPNNSRWVESKNRLRELELAAELSLKQAQLSLQTLQFNL